MMLQQRLLKMVEEKCLRCCNNVILGERKLPARNEPVIFLRLHINQIIQKFVF